MLFKEVDSCEDCPLNGEYCYANGDPDRYAPCQDEQYHEMEIEDVKHDIFMRQCRYEEAEDRRMKREEEKQAKKDAATAKRKATALKYYWENNEIKNCKKRIKKLTSFKQSLESLASAFSSVNEMFGYSKAQTEPKPKSAKIIEIEKQIAECEARIIEVNNIKKQRRKSEK